MIRSLTLLAALALPVSGAGAVPRDPSVERSDDQQQTQPTRKRERAKPTPAAPCSGCAAQPSAQAPMLETPMPGLLLIPAEAAAI